MSARPRASVVVRRHGLILIFVNLFDLNSIASVGIAVSLSVFVLVGLDYRLRREIRANTGLLAAAVAASALVLRFPAIDTLRNDPGTLVAIVVMSGLAGNLDAAWKRSRAHGLVSA